MDLRRLLVLMISLLSRIAPGLAAAWAHRLLSRPDRHPPQAWESVTPPESRRELLDGGLVARVWDAPGPGARAVLMLHGWSGRHSQFGPLIVALRGAGFRCIAVDPPAHGASPGVEAHPIAFADAAFAAAEALGPIHGAVGHSMGAGSLAYALTLERFAERAVLIAGPAAMTRVLDRYATLLRLAPRARAALFARVGRKMGVAEHDLDVERLPMPEELEVLVVHDQDDRDVPVAEAEAIKRNWPHAQVHLTAGLGHRRVLSDPETVARIVAFLKG
jgi:pimeloyl-ACP methyl ester carboxylesterase